MLWRTICLFIRGRCLQQPNYKLWQGLPDTAPVQTQTQQGLGEDCLLKWYLPASAHEPDGRFSGVCVKSNFRGWVETRNVLPAALEAMKDWGGCTRPDNAPYWSPSAAIWASVSAHPSLITSVHFSASPPQRDKSYCGRGRPVNFPECAGSGVAYVSLAQMVQQPRCPPLCPGRGVRTGHKAPACAHPALPGLDTPATKMVTGRRWRCSFLGDVVGSIYISTISVWFSCTQPKSHSLCKFSLKDLKECVCHRFSLKDWKKCVWVCVCVRIHHPDVGIEVNQDRSRSARIVQIRNHEKDGQRKREGRCEQNNHLYLCISTSPHSQPFPAARAALPMC